ncbi:MAG: DNA adenine methylase [Crenarchaeota archaeon]|nr:MAG: DNA adenine methylase [Thermoproteota archaeon]
MKIRPPFKIHGGKHYLNSWIISNFPKEAEKLDYIEPYCGAASVFFNKQKSEGQEVINDLDPGVTAILQCLRDIPEPLIKKLKKTTYSERVFKRELKKSEKKEFNDLFERAFNEFVIRRMSRGGLKKNFSWSNRKRGGKPGDVNAWETIISILPVLSERLQGTFIFNKPAISVIKAFNYENALVYCDPPYVPESRESKDAYDEMEMTTDDHIALAAALNNFKGKVILSGYPSTLYKRLYNEWRCVRKKVPNHSSQQKSKSIKVECIWMNY